MLSARRLAYLQGCPAIKHTNSLGLLKSVSNLATAPGRQMPRLPRLPCTAHEQCMHALLARAASRVSIGLGNCTKAGPKPSSYFRMRSTTPSGLACTHSQRCCRLSMHSARPPCPPFADFARSCNLKQLASKLNRVAAPESCCRPKRKGRCCVRCLARNETDSRTVVVLGGTGRVGSSTAVALLQKDPSLHVVVASRSRESFGAAVKKRPQLAKAEFREVRRRQGSVLLLSRKKTQIKALSATGQTF